MEKKSFQLSARSKTYNFKSYAKINISLYVGPPNSEGLHPLSSIFQQISLHDDIMLQPRDHAHSVTFVGQDVPSDNTCTKVLDILSSRLQQYWDIQITKHIPTGAGLVVVVVMRRLY